MFYSESDLIKKFSRTSKSRTLIDVGAHRGTFSKIYIRKGWKVIAFEPEKTNRAILEGKTKLFDNVTIVAKAVTDRSGGTIPFYTSTRHHGIHTIRPFHSTHEFAYEVETTTLKDELEELGIDGISILKVDVEGADFLVLKGLNWESYHPEIIMIEFMDSRTVENYNYTHHDVVIFMKEKGYVCYVSEWSEIKSYGEKGLVYKPLKWLNFEKYPLSHEPSWGNLIFVPEENEYRFKRIKYWQRFYNCINRIYPVIYRAKVLWLHIKS